MCELATLKRYRGLHVDHWPFDVMKRFTLAKGKCSKQWPLNCFTAANLRYWHSLKRVSYIHVAK